MLVREMVSYAPIPSTDSMVWFGWASVAEVRAWTMASVPARVERANWWGMHAAWKWLAYVCAKHRETSLRRRSPMTMPRTLPFGFLECYYPAQPDGLADLVGNVGFGKACGHRYEVL